jgi:type III pantothenate kinase
VKNNKYLLADIGNSNFHIYNGKEVLHLSYADALKKYGDKSIKYISVKQQLAKEVEQIENWENISSILSINGEYDTMGVDRKALCLSHSDGVFVDAGSAITVDVVSSGVYVGGYIFPGIKAMLKSYEQISPALKSTLNENISLLELPTKTKDGISYGIIASIKTLIEKHRGSKKLYFTGGDGKLLCSFFDEAIYDETLVFQGIEKSLEKKSLEKKS